MLKWQPESKKATTSVVQDQLARTASILQQMRKGTYTFAAFQTDLVRMLDPLVALATFPVQRSTQLSTPFPSLLLVVDEVAETVGPVEAPLNVSLPADLTPEVAPLHQLNGPASIRVEHVRVRLTANGSRVEVTLVDLGNGQAARAAKLISPGFFVGPVFVREIAERRPLALIYVYVEAPTGP